MKTLRFIGNKIVQPLRTRLSQNYGASIPELALTLPILVLLLIVAVDLGRACYYAIALSSAAHAAAVYGVQNPTDTTGMKDAANNSATFISGMVTTVTTGCECYDGSAAVTGCSAPPSCTPNNYVNYVSVNTSATYTPLISYPGLPATLTLSGSSFLRSGGD